MNRFSLLALLLSSLLLFQAHAEAPDELGLLRFNFDNDVVGDTDDFFSAGWSLQFHSKGVEQITEENRSALGRFIHEYIPGLATEAGMIYRQSTSLSQVIQTPADLSDPEPIPNDVPYAGTLGLTRSWSRLNDQRLNAFQLYLGVVGPASGAEQVQKFVHNDLGLGEDPLGWDNQVENELLLNLNYAFSRKAARFGKAGSWAGDASWGGGLGLGNLFTHLQAGTEFRFGYNLPQGFTDVPDQAGRGLVMDSVIQQHGEDDWRVYGSLVLRGTAIGYTVLLDGNLSGDGPSISYDPYLLQLVSGLHISKGPGEFRFNVYLTSNPADDSASSELNWANFSFAYRF